MINRIIKRGQTNYSLFELDEKLHFIPIDACPVREEVRKFGCTVSIIMPILFESWYGSERLMINAAFLG